VSVRVWRERRQDEYRMYSHGSDQELFRRSRSKKSEDVIRRLDIRVKMDRKS
jgi:hypothetical protein